jgi:hypothetical protein
MTIPHPELVLCIPGPWKNYKALGKAVEALDDGYVTFGLVLMDTASGFGCDIQLEKRDPRMKGAFMSAGPHWHGTPAMEAIDKHASVVYLIGYGGTPGNVDAMMKAAATLVRAGGLGVKVESSGIAHAPDEWLRLCEFLHLHAAHRGMVVFVTGMETYSCGMHNFGLKDAITAQANSVELLRAFTHYLLTESPDVRDGQTFAVSEEAPVYIVRAHPGVPYEEGSLFANPYGAWYLVPRGAASVH